MDAQHHLQPDFLLAEVARRQFGAFTLMQARESGLTRHQVAHRLGSGRWETLHPGVFRLRGVPDGRGLATIAGLLYAGHRALFSHATAARLHGFEPQLWHPHVWLTIPERTRRRPRPGLRIVRSRRIDGFTAVAHSQPVLSIERTVVDLAGVLDVASFRRLLADVVARELVTTDGVLSAADDFGGRRGVAAVRRALAEFDPAFESGLEQEADELFRGAGIILDRQVEVRADGILLARLDFADERIKLGIEVDGSRYHSSVSARSYDRQRDRALARRGWHIERFTTDDVRRRPRETQRQVADIKASRAELFKRAG